MYDDRIDRDLVSRQLGGRITISAPQSLAEQSHLRIVGGDTIRENRPNCRQAWSAQKASACRQQV